ncbi:MAG: phage protease [Luteolibacter sp.]
MQVRASFGTAIGNATGEIPTEIVYIPEGSHSIFPTVDGKPKRVTVNLDATKGDQVAAQFQRELNDRMAGNVRPHLDFDHAGKGAASAIPKAFRYETGKGLVLAIDWTSSGKAAIEGRDYSYFSPEFMMDEQGVPVGLPLYGSIGSLVNEPAFREIPRIAASDQSGAASEPDTNTPIPMNPLVQCGLLNEQEAALADHPETARKRVAAMNEEITNAKSDASDKDAKIAELEAENAALKKEKEDSAVAAKQAAEKAADERVAAVKASHHVTEEQAKNLREYVLAGNPLVEAYVGTFKKKGDPTTPVIKAGESTTKDGDKEPTGLARVTAALAEESATN